MTQREEIILKNLKADFEKAREAKEHNDSLRRKYLDAYNGVMYGNETDNSSKAISKDIQSMLKWQEPALMSPFVTDNKIAVFTPITAEDEQAIEKHAPILNTQFCRQFDRFEFIKDMVHKFSREGTVVTKDSWAFETQIQDVQIMSTDDDEDDSANGSMSYDNDEDDYGNVKLKKIVKREVPIVNRPDGIVCDNNDIFLDPTNNGSHKNSKFTIERIRTNMSNLLSEKGKYMNLDKVLKSVKMSGSEAHTSAEDLSNATVVTNDAIQFRDDFHFQDIARKEIIIYEYWGLYDLHNTGIAEPIVATWFEDVLIRLSENPFPGKKSPYHVAKMDDIDNSPYGAPDFVSIIDDQQNRTALLRGMIDSVSNSNFGQKGIKMGILDPANKRRFFAGLNFEYSGNQSDIFVDQHNPLSGTTFQFFQSLSDTMEAKMGIKSFSGGVSGDSLGNMLDINTKVPLIDGTFKILKDIVDGDKLIGSNGKSTTVIKAHEIKFPKQAYDMKFSNGSVVKSGGEHLWTVKIDGTKHSLRKWTTLSADEIYSYVKKGKRVVIPRIQKIHTGKSIKEYTTIDPYVLGFWLGDGMSHSARITCADYEVITNFKDAGYTCIPVRDSSKCGKATMYDVYKTGHMPKRSESTGQFETNGSFHSELKELNLHARYGGVKHIPEIFMNATYEEKMELIRGLMDSDGFAHSGSFVQFSQSEGQLQRDFIKLIKTLGLKTSIRTKDPEVVNKHKTKSCCNNDSKMIVSRKVSYEIGFTPWSNPFKLKRKANKWKEPYIKTVKLQSMEKTDKVLMRCLTVDSKDKLFAVTDKYTLTHNTATGVRGTLTATDMRKMHHIRNLAENIIKPMLRSWVNMNEVFLSEEDVYRYTNKKFDIVHEGHQLSSIDMDIQISTPEVDNIKAQELAYMMQTLGQRMSFERENLILSKIAELRDMPKLADDIRNEKQPEPSEMQIKLQQLEIEKAQLENDMVRADIMYRRSAAEENGADYELKIAKSLDLTESANGKKLSTDMIKSGIKFNQERAVAEHESMLRERENSSKNNIAAKKLI